MHPFGDTFLHDRHRVLLLRLCIYMFFQVFITFMNFLVGKMAACVNLEVVTLRNLHLYELVRYFFNGI